MKKILLIALVLLSVFSSAQNNYNRVNSRYNYLGLAADAFNLPGVGTAALKTAQMPRAGAMVYDSTGGSRGVYVYAGAATGWIKLYDTLMTVVSPNFYTTDGTTSGARAVNLGGNLTFSGHNTRSITFDSVNTFTASRNGVTRISFNSGNTSIFNSTQLGALVMSSGNTILTASGGIDLIAPLTDIKGGTAILGLRDSIYIRVPTAGDLRIYPLNHSLVATGKMMVWDSINGQVTTRAIPGGSTPTLQQVLATEGNAAPIAANTVVSGTGSFFNWEFVNLGVFGVQASTGISLSRGTNRNISLDAATGVRATDPDSVKIWTGDNANPYIKLTTTDVILKNITSSIDTTTYKPLAGDPTTGNTRMMNSWAQVSGGGGSGDVVGPASSTNYALPSFDGTTGKLLRNGLILTNAGGDLILPATKNLTIGSTRVMYLPDQTNFLNTIYIGNGGASLSHGSGTEGQYNTFMGIDAGLNATTAEFNMGFGGRACRSLTSGKYNVGIGDAALYALENGNYNIGIGQATLTQNISSDYNIAIGYQSQYTGTSASANTSVGTSTLRNNVTGSQNTAFGQNSLYNNEGSNNTAYGYASGVNITSGSKNIIIGHNIDIPIATGSNQLNIGNIIFGTGVSGTGTTIAGDIGIGTNAPSAQLHTTGTVRFANFGAGTATFDASGNVTSVSDSRLKYIQGNYRAGLKEIKNINPIIYKWRPESNMETSNTYAGFSAQNIKDALGNEATGINKEGYLSVQDRAIMAAMINAIKELSAKVDYLEAELKKKK